MSARFAFLQTLERDRRLRARILLAIATLLFTVIAAYFYVTGSARIAAANDTKQRNAWSVASSSAPTITLENFLSTWGAKRSSNAEQTSINWQVRDTVDLRNSLLALDATRVAAQRISVTKRETDYAVVTEVAK
jgi:hypothetical protein